MNVHEESCGSWRLELRMQTRDRERVLQSVLIDLVLDYYMFISIFWWWDDHHQILIHQRSAIEMFWSWAQQTPSPVTIKQITQTRASKPPKATFESTPFKAYQRTNSLIHHAASEPASETDWIANAESRMQLYNKVLIIFWLRNMN